MTSSSTNKESWSKKEKKVEMHKKAKVVNQVKEISVPALLTFEYLI